MKLHIPSPSRSSSITFLRSLDKTTSGLISGSAPFTLSDYLPDAISDRF